MAGIQSFRARVSSRNVLGVTGDQLTERANPLWIRMGHDLSHGHFRHKSGEHIEFRCPTLAVQKPVHVSVLN
jgi:hypothetical protein